MIIFLYILPCTAQHISEKTQVGLWGREICTLPEILQGSHQDLVVLLLLLLALALRLLMLMSRCLSCVHLSLVAPMDPALSDNSIPPPTLESCPHCNQLPQRWPLGYSTPVPLLSEGLHSAGQNVRGSPCYLCFLWFYTCPGFLSSPRVTWADHTSKATNHPHHRVIHSHLHIWNNKSLGQYCGQTTLSTNLFSTCTTIHSPACSGEGSPLDDPPVLHSLKQRPQLWGHQASSGLYGPRVMALAAAV